MDKVIKIDMCVVGLLSEADKAKFYEIYESYANMALLAVEHGIISEDELEVE